MPKHKLLCLSFAMRPPPSKAAAASSAFAPDHRYLLDVAGAAGVNLVTRFDFTGRPQVGTSVRVFA